MWLEASVLKPQTPSSGGRPFNSINLQTVIAFREMGKGYHSMCTFTSMMNMPPPMRANTYDKINDTLYTVYNNVAEQSMHNAAEETRHSLKHDIAAGEIINTGVTVDGAWSKRGLMYRLMDSSQQYQEQMGSVWIDMSFPKNALDAFCG